MRGATLTFDNSAPTSGLALPLDGKFYNTLSAINGAAFDAVGLSTVALSVRNASIAGPNNCYTPGGAFTVACPGWFKASGSNNPWNFTFSPLPWTQANQYVVLSSATDLAANVQVALSSAGFTYDIGVPTAAVTAPAVAYFKDNTSFAGTAEDAPAGVASVFVALSSGTSALPAGSAGSWWSGSAFTATSENYLATTGNWTLSLAGITFTNGKTYMARVRTRDNALPAPNERVQDSSFLFDNAAPAAAVVGPANGAFKNALFTISGTALDADPGSPLLASGLSTVTISIQEVSGAGASGNCYVPGGAFSAACPNYFGAAGTPAAWRYTPPSNPYTTGRSYRVTARAADLAANAQRVFTVGTSSNTFIYDQTLPRPRSPCRRRTWLRTH